ncbi:MAG: hypothetical protein ACRD4W_02795 [Nitrososphaeraceae archaeon]
MPAFDTAVFCAVNRSSALELVVVGCEFTEVDCAYITFVAVAVEVG